MNSWAAIKLYVDRHSLPYRVQRFNMSLRGALVDTFTGAAVAYSVREAKSYLEAL